jgi:hypothetical protein
MGQCGNTPRLALQDERVPYSSMQWGYTALVECVGVRASIDEIRDQLALRIRIRARTSIRSVVERIGPSSVLCANGGALCDQ